MKTFELKLNRSRCISFIIAVLCIVLIVMMLSPYFTFGKRTTTLIPAGEKGDGTQDMLFGKTWVLEGADENDEDYKKLIVSATGKDSKLQTNNKLRVNQKFALDAFNTALENYDTIAQNYTDCLDYENQAWEKYNEIGKICNQLAASMGKPAFELKQRSAEEEAVVEEEASEEGGEETAEAAEAEEDLVALSQEGDPYAEEYKTLTTAMRTANRQLETAISSRQTAKQCLTQAKEALDKAYEACLAVYSYEKNENGEYVPITEGAIDPSLEWVKIKSSEYNRALTTEFADDHLAAVLSVKDDDFKKWYVAEGQFAAEYAASLGVGEDSILDAALEALLAGDKKDAFVEGFVKPDSGEFTKFISDNEAKIVDAVYEARTADLGAADYEAYAVANADKFSAYVNENKAALTEKLYLDATDNARTKAAYIKDMNTLLYKAFIKEKCQSEFVAYLADASRKNELSEELYAQYVDGEDKNIPDHYYSDFVTANKTAEYKEYLTELAIAGADANLAAELKKVADAQKQVMYQGNLSIMYEDFAKANLDSFKQMLYQNYADKETVEYKLYAEANAETLKAWFEDAANGASDIYTEAKAAKIKAADKKKDREAFYQNHFKTLSAEQKAEIKKNFFDFIKGDLKDADQTKIYEQMNASILSRMSAEDRDAIVYGELDKMLAVSNAAYVKAKNAASKSETALKNGQASKTSKKAEKTISQIQKQIDKVRPIFDDVRLISAKENRYNTLIANEALKDQVFATFMEDQTDLFDNALIKNYYQDEVKQVYYETMNLAAAEGKLDDLDAMIEDAKKEFLLEKKDELKASGQMDEYYEKFINELHVADFKDWLYDHQEIDVKGTGAAATEEPAEEPAADTGEEAADETVDETADTTEATDTTEEPATAAPASKLSAKEEYMAGIKDPNEFEADQTESLIMESTAQVKYTKRANEDVATVTIEFENGEKKETTFSTEVNYDKIEKVSILGFVAFPEDYAASFESTVADYKIASYSRNSVVLVPIILLILLVVGIVLAFVYRDSFASGICPAAAGIIGILGFAFSTFLKLGSSRTAFIILFALLLVISCIQIFLCIKDKREAAKNA